MTKFLFSVMALLFLSATTCLGQKEANSIVKDREKYNLSDTLLRDWNKDKNACLGLRCKYMTTITENKSLIGMPSKKLIELLGRPNDKEEDTCYIYNLCSNCDIKNRIKKDADQFWMAFYFEEDKLAKIITRMQ